MGLSIYGLKTCLNETVEILEWWKLKLARSAVLDVVIRIRNFLKENPNEQEVTP